VEDAYQEKLSKIIQTFHQELTHLQDVFANFTKRANLATPVWSDAFWQDWTPSTDLPQITRLGEMQFVPPTTQDTFSLPIAIPLPGEKSLLLKTKSVVKSETIQTIQSLLIRLLASIPPAKVNFTFLDPVGLGQNVAPFMSLADYLEDLVNSKAWSEPQHIEKRLAELTEHMENVIQKYLRGQYATIEEYNAEAGEVAEPYQIVVAFDFPVNFNDDSARRLVSVAKNGPRCGVYAVILIDTEKPLPHGFNIAELEQSATVLEWDGQRFVWKDEDYEPWLLQLDTPPDKALFDRIIQTVGEQAVEASKVEVPFERIAPTQEEWWTQQTTKGLIIPLGPTGARKVQTLDLGQGTAQHALVVGKTGSGKSTLLHTLITSTSLSYSPEEIEIYLIDFKKGVEFKTYATHRLPHARVIAIESEREFGISVLQGLDAELKRRGDLYRAAGVDNIANYRQKQDQTMSRILLLVDEFQEFFTEDDAIASQASQILDRLVRQGRAFGIHVLLGSQTLAGAYNLARSTIDQMAVRIALQCSEADSRLILSDDNPAARLLSRPGEAIYNSANGLIEGNNRFQVAWLTDEERDHFLDKVQELARERNYQPTQIIFEGNASAEVEKNHLLQKALGEPAPTAVPKSLSAWLGEPIAIQDPLAAIFRRQSGSNLLIVGQKDEEAMGMMASTLVSLSAQLPNGTKNSVPCFSIIDYSPADVSYSNLFQELSTRMTHPTIVGKRRQLPDMMNQLATEVQRRIDEEDETASPIFLFINGLQRARDLREEEDFSMSFDDTAPPSPARQLTTILREGPDVGVHTVVWCDTVTNLNRTIDRRALREFVMRVAFQMSAEDSSNLIDTPAASKIGQHRALFQNEEDGIMEKFRPYSIPSNEWLSWVGEQLKQ
jgi:energy-coupling factor transporter ATP-binding protein EcfA2